jgi:hypothetical protein
MMMDFNAQATSEEMIRILSRADMDRICIVETRMQAGPTLAF